MIFYSILGETAEGGVCNQPNYNLSLSLRYGGPLKRYNNSVGMTIFQNLAQPCPFHNASPQFYHIWQPSNQNCKSISVKLSFNTIRYKQLSMAFCCTRSASCHQLGDAGYPVPFGQFQLQCMTLVDSTSWLTLAGYTAAVVHRLLVTNCECLIHGS